MSSRRFWAVRNRTANPVVPLVLRPPLGLPPEPPDSADRSYRPQERPGVHPPVGYEQRGDCVRITVGSPEQKRWWRNLTDAGAPVRMWLRGVERSGHAISGGDQRSGVTVDIAFDHPAASVRRSPTNPRRVGERTSRRRRLDAGPLVAPVARRAADQPDCGVRPAAARSARSLMPSSIRRSIRNWGNSTKSV
jgi:hypothetical protein